MNTQPEQSMSETPERLDMKAVWKRLPSKAWRLLTHNWPWKLLALFLALCLWAGLITQDASLTRERVFSDVSVSVTGSDTLRRNGLIVVSDLYDDASTVRLRVEVPQREYNSVTSANYNPRVDLSKITEAGVQSLKITSTSSSAYGTVTEVSPDSFEVEVDKYVTNYRVPVTVRKVGDYPAGFYGTTPSLDPSSVTVSGPQSVVDQIARVVVEFDVSRLTAQAGLTRSALPVIYEDADGNPVQSELIEVTSSGVLLRSIVVEQQLYATKSLAMNTLAMTTGEPAEGYEIKSVSVTPNTLTAAGEQTALAALDTLFLEQAIDVTGRDESFIAEVRVRKPSELTYLSSESVMVYVEIGAKMATKTFSAEKLYVYAPDGVNASSATKTVDVTITGPELMLDSLSVASLAAYCTVEQTEAGDYALPVQLTISDPNASSFTYMIAPQNVQVTIAGE